MRYLLLIYGDESQAPHDQTPEQAAAAMQPWFGYTQWLRDKGWFLGGEALEPTASATTVRAGEDGTVMPTDGPFAETKEQLGGYYLIECANLDEAIDAASRIPSVALGGSIEVRPIMELSEAPS